MLNQIVFKMQTKVFTKEEMRGIKTSALAKKYDCSIDYVRRVLTWNRDRKTILFQKILRDAVDFQEIMDRKTIIII
jgi:Mor family transcriptional regulator